jgi:2-polyprenyl-3-methyl-5-hydroxy-6-metoxy-1,4-benzoquinol methylase
MFCLTHLKALRTAELDKVVAFFPRGARILEIGAGTGDQAAQLVARGFAVEALEVSNSNYTDARIFPITNYDGSSIPFPDNYFDVVYSSNVLEHVADLSTLHAEVKRVLSPNGYAVHVLPTHVWRIWTILTSVVSGFEAAIKLGRKLAPPLVPGSNSWRQFFGAWVYAAKCVYTGLFRQERHGERGNVLS